MKPSSPTPACPAFHITRSPASRCISAATPDRLSSPPKTSSTSPRVGLGSTRDTFAASDSDVATNALASLRPQLASRAAHRRRVRDGTTTCGLASVRKLAVTVGHARHRHRARKPGKTRQTARHFFTAHANIRIAIEAGYLASPLGLRSRTSCACTRPPHRGQPSGRYASMSASRRSCSLSVVTSSAISVPPLELDERPRSRHGGAGGRGWDSPVGRRFVFINAAVPPGLPLRPVFGSFGPRSVSRCARDLALL